MKKYIKLLIYFLILTGISILIGGLFTSKYYHYEKSIEINTNPLNVWKNVKSIKQINKWMPYSNINKKTLLGYSGKDGEINSSLTWNGEGDIGDGTIILKDIKIENINDLDPEFQILYKLERNSPKKQNAIFLLNIEPFNKNTIVTWEVKQHIPYPLNFIIVNFTNQDFLFEKNFSEGLVNLKQISE